MEFVGIEKLSLVDFDHHLSTTLFTPGCNFACPFCHNKDLVTGTEYQPIPFDEIISFLKKRVGVLDAVVITGGEPTLHKDLVDKITKIKELGFLIKLDTNGTNPEMIKELVDFKLIDYIAMDLKNCFDKYPLTAGRNIDLNKIKQSINYLMEDHIPYEFRTTIVKELHSLDDMKKMANEINGASKIRLQLFKDSETCIKRGLHPIDKETALEFIKAFKNHVSDYALRGYED